MQMLKRTPRPVFWWV